MLAIPQADLLIQHRTLKDELDRAVAACVDGSSFIGGADHAAFSVEFSAFCGGGFTALCGNGTDALTLAILALLGEGNGEDEIITVSNTFIATVEAIVAAGYVPKFVEIDRCSHNMDPVAFERAITPQTRAVIPVHLYAQMAPMDAIADIARSHGLKIIEDACQAHGAAWLGLRPGHYGDCACFSFFPGKNIGAWGDGGAVFTCDGGLAVRIARIGDHGSVEKYIHQTLGRNSRLDGLQAAVLRVKLPPLDAWNAQRRAHADAYRSALGSVEAIGLPHADPCAEHVYHQFVVRVPERDRVFAQMREAGIGVGIHYPIPCHEQPACRRLTVDPASLAVTSELAKSILSLPMFPELTPEQIVHISHVLTGIVKYRR